MHYLLKTPIHVYKLYENLDYKCHCILIKHVKRIKKGLYYHKGGGVFFHRKNTLSDKYET